MQLNVGIRILNAKFTQRIQNHFFRESETNIEFFRKLYPYVGVFYIFEVCKNRKSNLLSYGILVQGFIMPNLVNEYKTIFLDKRD